MIYLNLSGLIYMKSYKIKDYRKQRWDGYKSYHTKMMTIGDCDPALPALRYLSDRFEFNLEQKYWLAFLYSTNYCVPTTFFMINEFPDFENVDCRRVEKWWNKNKQFLFFQTDRKKVKNFNKFVPMVESYKKLMGDSQIEVFKKFAKNNPQDTYKAVYNFVIKNIYYVGRFSTFLYLEALHAITDFNMLPDGLDLKNSESSRNGLLYACGMDEFITLHHKKASKLLTPEVYIHLKNKLQQLHDELKSEAPELPTNFWNIETSLCAYKKLFWGARYLGYYIDRQMAEIKTMEDKVKEGVDWSVLWNFRTEYFDKSVLGELMGWKGIRNEKMDLFMKAGILYEGLLQLPVNYKHIVEFSGHETIYS